MTDPRAILGAANNADLYAAVFKTHGLGFARRADGFAALDPPPPFYGHGVVTQPGGGETLLAHLKDRFGPRIAAKDSFSELDPAAHGMRILFEASWLWHAPGGRGPNPWARVTSDADLLAWETAWKAESPTDRRMFPPSFLCHAEIALFAAWEGTEVVAGCIVNRSNGALGLSNVFGADPETFVQAANAASTVAPHLPLVGYEQGDALDAACRAGFAPVGDLRVLVPA